MCTVSGRFSGCRGFGVRRYRRRFLAECECEYVRVYSIRLSIRCVSHIEQKITSNMPFENRTYISNRVCFLFYWMFDVFSCIFVLREFTEFFCCSLYKDENENHFAARVVFSALFFKSVT